MKDEALQQQILDSLKVVRELQRDVADVKREMRALPLAVTDSGQSLDAPGTNFRKPLISDDAYARLARNNGHF
jgi:hypothetical protein